MKFNLKNGNGIAAFSSVCFFSQSVILLAPNILSVYSYMDDIQQPKHENNILLLIWCGIVDMHTQRKWEMTSMRRLSH